MLCLDCTRYDASDQLAMVLAIVSLTPYLAIFQVASVGGFQHLLSEALSRVRAIPMLNWSLRARPCCPGSLQQKATARCLDTCGHDHVCSSGQVSEGCRPA